MPPSLALRNGVRENLEPVQANEVVSLYTCHFQTVMFNLGVSGRGSDKQDDRAVELSWCPRQVGSSSQPDIGLGEADALRRGAL